MIYKLDECIYKKEKGYTFKEQLFLNNNNKLVYCLIADKNGVIECLDENLDGFTKEYKDYIISKYLDVRGE